MTSVTST